MCVCLSVCLSVCLWTAEHGRLSRSVIETQGIAPVAYSMSFGRGCGWGGGGCCDPHIPKERELQSLFVVYKFPFQKLNHERFFITWRALASAKCIHVHLTLHQLGQRMSINPFTASV